MVNPKNPEETTDIRALAEQTLDLFPKIYYPFRGLLGEFSEYQITALQILVEQGGWVSRKELSKLLKLPLKIVSKRIIPALEKEQLIESKREPPFSFDRITKRGEKFLKEKLNTRIEFIERVLRRVTEEQEKIREQVTLTEKIKEIIFNLSSFSPPLISISPHKPVYEVIEGIGGPKMREEVIRKLEEKRGRISYEEFLEWCDEDTLAEWVDGEIIFYSPASDRHQDILGFLSGVLRDFVEHYDLGKIRYAPFQMKLPTSGREPDLLFIAKENIEKIKKTYLDGPADMVVEIISPDSSLKDKRTKFGEYERGGVREYWLIDYEKKKAEFYVLNPEGKYDILPIDPLGIYRSKVIQGFWLNVDWLWQESLPSIISTLKELGILT